MKDVMNIFESYYQDISNKQFMREILSLSLPAKLKKLAMQRARERGFGSVSAYIKKLLLEDDDLISEKELLEDIRIAEKEHAEGKLKTLETSILDLYDQHKN